MQHWGRVQNDYCHGMHLYHNHILLFHQAMVGVVCPTAVGIEGSRGAFVEDQQRADPQCLALDATLPSLVGTDQMEMAVEVQLAAAHPFFLVAIAMTAQRIEEGDRPISGSQC